MKCVDLRFRYEPMPGLIIILAAILLPRFVHARSPQLSSEIQGHQSVESQSVQISSSAQLTREPAALTGPDEMESGLNNDKSYVLIPLRELMRSRRTSDVKPLSGADEDPLYVMFPFQEIMRKTRASDGKEEITEPIGKRLNLSDSKVDSSDRRRRRHISLQPKWPLSAKKVSKRRPLRLFVRRGRMSPSDMMDEDYDVHGEALTKLTRTNGGPFSIDRPRKKSKAVELRSQLHPEMFDGPHQKSRVLTEFIDLSPKVLQTVIGKPKKSSSNPINITMFISNLIPPNEVENTRITNAGKLYKSGCLKFSIQLERPACSTDEVDDLAGKSTCSAVVTNKMACGVHGSTDDKGKPVDGSSPSPQGCCASASAVSKLQNVGPADSSRGSDLTRSNPDASSLLLQLLGADSKHLKKPASATAQQAVLLDNDVIKELQRLFANQAASNAPDSGGKSTATLAPISQSNPKARAIAEALNLFSKYTSLKQLRSS